MHRSCPYSDSWILLDLGFSDYVTFLMLLHITSVKIKINKTLVFIHILWIEYRLDCRYFNMTIGKTHTWPAPTTSTSARGRSVTWTSGSSVKHRVWNFWPCTNLTSIRYAFKPLLSRLQRGVVHKCCQTLNRLRN